MRQINSLRAKLWAGFRGWLDRRGLYPDIQYMDSEKIGEEAEVQKFTQFKENLKGDELKDVSAYLQKMATSEGERERQIESKALSLIGFTGLVSTFVIGFFQFGLDSNSVPDSVRGAIGLVYAIAGFSLIMTVACAIGAVKVGKYNFMSPSEEDLFSLTAHNREHIFQEHAYDLVKSYVFNHKLIDAKADYVAAAQNWFRNAVILLVALLIIFGVQFISPPTHPSPTLPAVIILTTTPVPTLQPSATPTLTNTATITLSPTAPATSTSTGSATVIATP